MRGELGQSLEEREVELRNGGTSRTKSHAFQLFMHRPCRHRGWSHGKKHQVTQLSLINIELEARSAMARQKLPAVGHTTKYNLFTYSDFARTVGAVGTAVSDNQDPRDEACFRPYCGLW
jgi:hypothetical protein